MYNNAAYGRMLHRTIITQVGYLKRLQVTCSSEIMVCTTIRKKRKARNNNDDDNNKKYKSEKQRCRGKRRMH
jgi:sensor c-di-GMP phosphodiesterase-like protein